jgi:hypothetical protein
MTKVAPASCDPRSGPKTGAKPDRQPEAWGVGHGCTELVKFIRQADAADRRFF